MLMTIEVHVCRNISGDDLRWWILDFVYKLPVLCDHNSESHKFGAGWQASVFGTLW